MKRLVWFLVISQLIMFGMAQQKLTPEMLWSLGRVGSASVSPDGTKVLYDATFYDVDADRGFRDLYITDLNGAPAVRITETPFNENAARWLPNGKIVYSSTESGSNQIWIMDADGKNRKQISNIEGLMEFKFDVTGTKLLYTKAVKLDKEIVDVYSDLPKANGRIIDEMMFRHWDSWHDYTYNHVFIAELKGEQWIEAKDIMAGERFDSPIKPMGGIEQVAWSPDGKLIAYACKKKSGKAYAVSTNSEIYLYNVETGTTENISEGYMGYDIDPMFSPDGTKLIWSSMERDGFEADKTRLILYDFKTKTKTDLSKGIDQSFSNFSFSPDGKQIFTISGVRATYQIFSYDLKTNKFNQITKGVHNYLDYDFAGKFLVATKQSMSMPTEVFKVEIATGKETQLTFVNKKTWVGLKLAEVKERTVKTTDGKDMLVWVVYPPNFDPNKKYPTLLYCQGGPQSAVSQFFSYRWNMQLIAANDYIIVAPNRRGLPTFGQEWNDQISKDYGGQNVQDYLSAIDDVAKEPYVNKDKLGAVGASYGGFSVFWLAGNHQKRFKAFIAHAGIFNFESMYGATEETFFVDWDMGGPYWAPQAKNSYSASPHKFVKNWDTPIMIIQGGKDFRIPETQAFEAFNVAQMLNIPSKFLYFPEENHWMLKPQNSLLWQREFFKWLDTYLK